MAFHCRKHPVFRLSAVFLAAVLYGVWPARAAADTPELVLKGHKGETLCVAFSPDGKTIATGGADGKVRLWEVATGKETAAFDAGPANAVGTVRTLTVAFAAEGKLLLASTEYHVNDDGLEIKKGIVQAWDLASKQPKYQIDCLWAPFLAVTASGKVFAYDNGTRKNLDVILCDGETGKQITVFPNRDEVYSLAISADGSLMAAGTETGVDVWDTKGPNRLTHKRLGAHELAFAPDGKSLAIESEDITLLDLNDLDKIVVRDTSKVDIYPTAVGRGCLRYSPDGKMIAYAEGGEQKAGGLKGDAATLWGEVRLLHSWSANPILVFGTRTRHIGRCKCGASRCIAFSPDGKLLATAGNEEVVRLWKVEDE